MNTYYKLMPNVFLAKCPEPHSKGEVVELSTKYGKTNEHIIHNLVFERDGYFYYSITRADGYNIQERAKRKAERYNSWAAGAEKKSAEYYKRSQKDADFLRLGEPIKVGHHSEKRHRKAHEDAYNNMGKFVALSEKAKEHESKAEYWNRRQNDINLSLPESLEFFQFKLEEAKETHEGLKNGSIERTHAYSLTYAKKEVTELEKKVAMAKKLWGE